VALDCSEDDEVMKAIQTIDKNILRLLPKTEMLH